MNYTKFKIGTTIRKILTSDESVIKLVGKENIKPLVAPKNTKGNIILYQRDEYSKNYTNMGISSEKCNVLITAISDDYDISTEMAEIINNAMEGDHEKEGIRIKLIDSTEDFGDGKYIQVLLFSIT